MQEMQSFMTISDDDEHGNFQFQLIFFSENEREFVKCNQRLFIPCRAENIILKKMPTASSSLVYREKWMRVWKQSNWIEFFFSSRDVNRRMHHLSGSEWKLCASFMIFRMIFVIISVNTRKFSSMFCWCYFFSYFMLPKNKNPFPLEIHSHSSHLRISFSTVHKYKWKLFFLYIFLM